MSFFCQRIFCIRPRFSRCFSSVHSATLSAPVTINSHAGMAQLSFPSPDKEFVSTLRSHTCGELRLHHVGSKVSLCGWVHRFRFERFLLLRDTYGLVQVILNSDLINPVSLTSESVLQVNGTVVARPEKDVNKELPTGNVEVVAEGVTLLSQVRLQLPFLPCSHQPVNELLRLSVRYLDLRRVSLQRNLKFRSDLTINMRQILSSKYGFVDIETPYLFRRTPGGAREFVTPTCFSGYFYSLPQSPQQFKQLLMIGGVDRYMQIARCFRDEPSRTDRQPEFTQLDLEMAFVSSSDVMSVIENLLISVWPIVQEFRNDDTPLSRPFPRMSYSHAMARFGSDKPDLRFGFEFVLLESENVVGFKVDHASFTTVSLGDWKKLVEDTLSLTGVSVQYVKAESCNVGLGPLPISLQAEPADTIVFCYGTSEKELKALGHARVKLASLLHSKGIPIYAPGIHFHWVHDFPLFELSHAGTWTSVHHPFTAPTPETLHFVRSDPARVISQHYDLVCNGQEVGGGSIRIHDADLQEYILSHILKEDVSTMNYFLNALKSGAPPHGGIALGLDRLLAIFTDSSSIREVIAFPKAADGKDLMCGAPAKISAEDLQHYRIALS